jgi:hypothetical protein
MISAGEPSLACARQIAAAARLCASSVSTSAPRYGMCTVCKVAPI